METPKLVPTTHRAVLRAHLSTIIKQQRTPRVSSQTYWITGTGLIALFAIFAVPLIQARYNKTSTSGSIANAQEIILQGKSALDKLSPEELAHLNTQLGESANLELSVAVRAADLHVISFDTLKSQYPEAISALNQYNAGSNDTSKPDLNASVILSYTAPDNTKRLLALNNDRIPNFFMVASATGIPQVLEIPIQVGINNLQAYSSPNTDIPQIAGDLHGQTYTDAAKLFTATLPNTWNLGPSSTFNDGAFGEGTSFTPNTNTGTAVWVTISDSPLSPKEWQSKNSYSSEDGLGMTILEENETSINGYPTYYVKYNDNTGSYVVYDMASNGKVLSVMMETYMKPIAGMPAVDSSKYLPEFEAITHSVHFLSQ